MKRIIPVLIFSIVLSTTSCMKSLVKGMTSNVPFANKVLIHKNPKVGDYAILEGSGFQNTMKVIAVGSDSVTVRYESNATGISDLVFEAVLDFEGNVKKVDTIDKANNNERVPGTIAKPGDWAYMEWVKLTKEQIEAAKLPAKVTVKAGTFDYEIDGFKMSVMGTTTYMMYLTNKDAKFLQVASYSMMNDKVTLAAELSESGNKK